MIKSKNRSISYNGRSYELFLSFDDAQHICKYLNMDHDTGRHLNFLEIEELITSGIVHPRGNNRYYIVGKINGTYYMAVVYLVSKRCVVKSGRICNYMDMIHFN